MSKFMKHHQPREPKLPLPVMLRTDREKYELLARLTVTRPSLQQTLDERLFPPGWEKELEQLRKIQRKNPLYKDEDFLHNKDRVAKNIPPSLGRRK